MDKLIDQRYPRFASIYDEKEMIDDFTRLICEFQIDHHAWRCRNPTRCEYGHPQAVNNVSHIHNG
jgi:hypothetical protein